MGDDSIDWSKSTHRERACLSGPVRALRQRLGLPWSEVFRQAFGPRDHVGTEYESNLASGRIAVAKAWKLYEWLRGHDAALAAAVHTTVLELRAARVIDGPPGWEALRQLDPSLQVRVLKGEPWLGALDFARRHPVDPADLALMDEFYFEIDAPIPGRAIAFHGRHGLWYLLPLSEEAPTLELSRGTNALPTDGEGRPYPLREDERVGQHTFIFVVLDAPKTALPAPLPDTGSPVRPELLNTLAERILAVPQGKRVTGRITLFLKHAR
ncbi:hypothetical protein [Siccirubricoccus phaeus]|uniref:hypothetical protein n=1 Tax=Siccirubricoccus phaeus TaxID=2595053 RepID=UPI0011F2B168|nr:hypothetical protein [Siccirubricoccus phaeus]